MFSNFFIMKGQGIEVVKIRLYETPNCWVECETYDYWATVDVCTKWGKWRNSMGDKSYDIRDNG